MTTVKHLVMALCRALRPFRRYEGLVREHAALPPAFILVPICCTLLTELFWDTMTTVVLVISGGFHLRHGITMATACHETDVESLKIKYTS